MLDFLFLEPAAWPTGDLAAASLAALLWGLGSALLSPCHLGIIPLLSSHAAGVGPFSTHKELKPQPVADVLRFVAGYYLTILLFGLIIALLGSGLEMGGHYWTIPAGLVLLWFGLDMIRGHNCSSASHLLEVMGRHLGLGPHSGVLALGFGYGLLSGGCSTGFLVPVMMVCLPQGLLICLLLAACFGLGHCLPMIVVGCSASAAARILCHHDHAHGHDHDGNAHNLSCHHPDPHRREVLFRRVMGLMLLFIGVLFVLHPFLEHH